MIRILAYPRKFILFLQRTGFIQKKEIKGMLGPIFQKYNYKAKASDIQKYFNVLRVQIKNINTGKYDEGYKLISKKI